MSEEYDCQSCGACCEATPGELDYVLVRHDELDELFEHVPDYYVRTDRDGISALRTCVNDQGVTTCVALEGEIGEEVSCTIYENRPRACRNFQAGSVGCEMARSAFFGSDR